VRVNFIFHIKIKSWHGRCISYFDPQGSPSQLTLLVKRIFTLRANDTIVIGYFFVSFLLKAFELLFH
ncbi:hypothetical protein RCJ22_25260, partial [Vibrio sp. FNV 38]|nr:hypothetical protein [Vibrio sp. FNV 38]